MTTAATQPFAAPAAPTPGATHHVFTSESVSEGHPDKVCDFIADSVLDAHLAQDPAARVACEVLCKAGHVVLAGEITSRATVDHVAVAREAIRAIGYTDPAEAFNADGVTITELISVQSPEIGQGVDVGGAGDQGLMFGYATDESDALMPLPILLAHALAARLTADRKAGRVPWLRPDAKTQLSVAYDGAGRPTEVRTVLVSTQHAASVTQDEIRDYLAREVVPAVLGNWYHDGIELLVNPTGSFVEGGPSADCGVTGRKIIVDSYGGMGRHGGGAFSGKDPSKVDRSGAYFGRFVARQVVREGLARRCEVQVAYAIGRATPVSVRVDTFGTGDDARAERFVTETFDFRPQAIIERLGLRRPIYRGTTNYGHFGRAGLPWEA
ncbi:MAG TPA: methionine adenosyltransferase [Gemmatimonadaceae bacterium]|nr:methionine adenosyltransferase [Gemmatimonadaceae bacterium]